MSAKPNTSLNERTKHSSSTFMVSVSVPSMSNMTRCMGKWPNAPKLSDRGWRGQAWSTKKGRPPASVRWSAWLGGGSFLALVMLPACWTDYRALWYRDGPLVAVGMVVRLAQRVVCHDIENQVLGAIIGDLVRLVRLEEEGVAYLDWRVSLRVTDDAAA